MSFKYLALAAALTVSTAAFAQAPAPTGVQPGQPGSSEAGETSDRTPDKATQTPQAQQDTAGGKTSDRSQDKNVKVEHQPGAAGTSGSESRKAHRPAHLAAARWRPQQARQLRRATSTRFGPSLRFPNHRIALGGSRRNSWLPFPSECGRSRNGHSRVAFGSGGNKNQGGLVMKSSIFGVAAAVAVALASSVALAQEAGFGNDPNASKIKFRLRA